MTGKRVAMFVSHKVDIHRRAAHRIKAILESRTERLDVHISEDILPGDCWQQWIKQHISHSQILLVLLPYTAADLRWIVKESREFESVCPDGRVVVLKPPSHRAPAFFKGRQVIDASKDKILKHFLKPLYLDPEFVRPVAPLNLRITHVDLQRDAEEIEQALVGVVDVCSKFFGETLVVETAELDVSAPEGLDGARVRAPNGCIKILNWNKPSFLWKDLRERAAEDKGKGTFWVREMEQVITEVARGKGPPVMTSTFRGRGVEVDGKIFRPQLERVDYVDYTPVKYHFFFHEVLVPELVRGSDTLGDVFNLLHVATRVRWEVLNPFFVKLSLAKDTPPSRIDMSQEEKDKLLNRVLRSLRIIEQEAEKHDMFKSGEDAFGVDDRKLIVGLLGERERIYNSIEEAGQRKDFEQFMGELTRALDFNCRVTELLAKRFLELVQEDCGRVRSMLGKIRPEEA